MIKKAAYMAIYETLLEDIRCGRLKVGDQLPVEKNLADTFQVSVGTLRKATDLLELEGFILRRQGQGTFIASGKSTVHSGIDESFGYGVFQVLSDQKRLMKLLFGFEEKKFTVLPSPAEQSPAVSELYQSCSLVQLPLTLAPLPEISNFLSPLPEKLVKNIPVYLQRECRSINGEVKLLPVICNPTVCYCWKKGFGQAQILLPDKNWTFDDFFRICSELKKRTPQLPFLMTPSFDLLYDYLMHYYGGCFFDENGMPSCALEPLKKMICRLQKMLKDQEARLTYRMNMSIEAQTSRSDVHMLFCSPWLMQNLKHPEEWYVLPVPGGRGFQIAFGLGIPYNAPDKDAAMKILSSLADNRLENLRNCTPAAVSARRGWLKSLTVDNAQLLEGDVFFSGPVLSGHTGYPLWCVEFHGIMADMLQGGMSVEEGRKNLLKLFREKKIYNNFSNFLA